VYVNGEWLYRFEKVLALEGLVVLAVLVVVNGAGAWRLRPLALLASLIASGLLSAGLAWGANRWLSRALEGTYRNDQRLLALGPLTPGPPLGQLVRSQAEPVTMAAILRRGVLRVGVRSDGIPWAYRNRQGALVGYDLDLVRALARNLGVRVEVRVGSLAQLEQWLARQWVDLAVGGIQASPQRAARFRASVAYQRVHLALVVPDGKVGLIQGLKTQALNRPLRLAVSDPELLTADLPALIREQLAGPQGRLQLQIVPVGTKQELFRGQGGLQGVDALITTAEGGAALAVIHPRTSLLTSFDDNLQSDLVILVAGNDESLIAYLNSWLAREQGRGRMEALFRHWITLQDGSAGGRP